MKFVEREENGKIVLKIASTFKETIISTIFFFIYIMFFPVMAAFIFSRGDVTDPLFLLVVALAFGVFVFFVYMSRVKGSVTISEDRKNIVIGKNSLFGSPFEIEISPNDFIILKRQFDLRISTGRRRKTRQGRLREEARWQNLNKLKADMDSIIYEEKDFGGYIAKVPRLNLSEEEKQRLKQMASIFDFETLGNKSVNEVWSILFKPSNHPELIEIVRKNGTYKPEFNEMTERIAELCNIRMIDHTGAVPEIIEPTEVETSLATKVRAANIAPLGIEELQNVSDRITIEETEEGINLAGISDKLTFDDFFRGILGVSLLVIFVPWYIRSIPNFLKGLQAGVPESIGAIFGFTFFSFFILIISWIGFRLINGIYLKDIVNIREDKIRYTKRKLITKTSIDMPLDEIERVIVVQKGLFFTVELVSDEKRIPLGTGYSSDEALKFRDLIVTHLQ